MRVTCHVTVITVSSLDFKESILHVAEELQQVLKSKGFLIFKEGANFLYNRQQMSLDRG
jgi:hypothetical protein